MGTLTNYHDDIVPTNFDVAQLIEELSTCITERSIVFSSNLKSSLFLSNNSSMENSFKVSIHIPYTIKLSITQHEKNYNESDSSLKVKSRIDDEKTRNKRGRYVYVHLFYLRIFIRILFSYHRSGKLSNKIKQTVFMFVFIDILLFLL